MGNYGERDTFSTLPSGSRLANTKRYDVPAITNIYPNPSHNTFNIIIALPEEFNDVKLIVTDMIGRQIKQVEVGEKNSEVVLDASGFNHGIYLCHMVVNGKTIDLKKIIKY